MDRVLQVPDNIITLLRASTNIGCDVTLSMHGCVINPAEILRLQHTTLTEEVYDDVKHRIPQEWVVQVQPRINVNPDNLSVWVDSVNDLVRGGVGVLVNDNILLMLSHNGKIIEVSVNGAYSTNDSVREFLETRGSIDHLPTIRVVHNPEYIAVPYKRYIQIDTEWDSKPRNRGKAVTLPLSTYIRDNDPNYVLVQDMWTLDYAIVQSHILSDSFEILNLFEED